MGALPLNLKPLLLAIDGQDEILTEIPDVIEMHQEMTDAVDVEDAVEEEEEADVEDAERNEANLLFLLLIMKWTSTEKKILNCLKKNLKKKKNEKLKPAKQNLKVK